MYIYIYACVYVCYIHTFSIAMLTSDGFSVWLQTSGSILGSRPHATWLKVGWVAKIWKSLGFLFGNEEMIRSDGGFVFLTRKGLRKGLIGVSKSRKGMILPSSFFSLQSGDGAHSGPTSSTGRTTSAAL